MLLNNPFLLDGGQINRDPVQKSSVKFDYANQPSGLEAQLQGYYIGNNNTWNRAAFTFFNGFVSKQVTKNIQATLSVYNVFDNASQNYGYFGAQLPHQTNQYYTGPTDAIGQAVNIGLGTQEELFGISPRTFLFNLSSRI